ncbi:MAG: hypothetical protein RML72_05950 [Bacteroidia bacterium]|nr:hypothetical protein [Bacteroidia bacterium]MDW8158402.1 hypothetical protein [Bacteroidia bacterium]
MDNIIIAVNPFVVWRDYAKVRALEEAREVSFSTLVFLLDFFMEAYPLIVDGELDSEDEAFFIEETKRELTAQANSLGGNFEFLQKDPLDFDTADFLNQEVVNFSIDQLKFIARNFEQWSELFLSAYAGLMAAMVQFIFARNELYSLSEDQKEELSIRLLLDKNPQNRNEYIIAGILQYFTTHGEPKTDADADRLMSFLFKNDVFELGKPISEYPFQEIEDFQFSPVTIAKHLWLNKFVALIPHKLHKEHKKIIRQLLLRFGVVPELNLEVFASL